MTPWEVLTWFAIYTAWFAVIGWFGPRRYQSAGQIIVAYSFINMALMALLIVLPGLRQLAMGLFNYRCAMVLLGSYGAGRKRQALLLFLAMANEFTLAIGEAMGTPDYDTHERNMIAITLAQFLVSWDGLSMGFANAKERLGHSWRAVRVYGQTRARVDH